MTNTSLLGNKLCWQLPGVVGGQGKSGLPSISAKSQSHRLRLTDSVKSSIKGILFCILNNEFLMGFMAFKKVLANFVKLTSSLAIEKLSEGNWVKELI